MFTPKSQIVASLVLVIASLLQGCGGSPPPPPATAPTPRRTCLVLSVGAFKGIAHLGAIEALRERHVAIDCVVGNSMGALVGAVYAAYPGQNTTRRVGELVGAYQRETQTDTFLTRAIATGLVAFFTGGVGLLATGARVFASGDAVVANQSGNLAAAVGRSIRNPYIFEREDIRDGRAIDPGVDRALATGVEDACPLSSSALS